MPGSSLWLIPPEGSVFTKAIQSLISTKIPSLFPDTKTHDFIPHVTITSNVDPSLYGSDPQGWLDSLQIDTQGDIQVDMEAVEPGKPFFKKLTLRCAKDAGLLKLATVCRAEGVEGGDEEKAKKWADGDYAPHLSLL